MSYDWLASLEEYINDQFRINDIDPKQGWDDVLSMASDNLDEVSRGE